MATVAFDVCCCLFSAKGIVVICSGLLAATYLGVAYVLRKVAFPMLKKLHENWLSYMVIKYAHIPVMDWISEIKVLFIGALWYAGLAGLLGALFEVQLLLYPYVVYLCGSAYLSGKKVYDLVQDFLKFQNKLLESCNKVGGVLGLNCDEEFATAKKYTIGGGIVIALLMCTTLFCSIKLIYNIHRDTGAWLFTFCGASCGGDRSDGTRDEMALGKGWKRQRLLRGRVRRGGDVEKGFEMTRLRRSDGSLSDSSSDGSDRTFELPRAKR